MRGRAKVYKLTSKGEKYVSNLRLFRENIRERMLAVSMGRDLLFPDILASIEDTNILNETIDQLAGIIIRQVKVAFVLNKSGNSDAVKELKVDLNRVVSEILSLHRPKIGD